MKIVLAGATGFLGRPLAAALRADAHDLIVLTRRIPLPPPTGHTRYVWWNPEAPGGTWGAEVDGAGALVNLAGEPIADRRWTKARKARLRDSRLSATRSLVDAIRQAAPPPPVFVSSSGVGYYGLLDDTVVTETAPAGTDFIATLCAQWEAEAARAASDRTRVVCLRGGLIIEKDGGALGRMLLPFQLGVGGSVGSGARSWPWIHRLDWIDMVRWAIATPAASGPFNATAPNPVTSREFARALGRALHRPAIMPAPAFMLRLLFGEMAGSLLLSGQRAVPTRAEQLGFTFRYRDLDAAFAAIFRKTSA